jgi:hypothetical protein
MVAVEVGVGTDHLEEDSKVDEEVLDQVHRRLPRLRLFPGPLRLVEVVRQEEQEDLQVDLYRTDRSVGRREQRRVYQTPIRG